MFNGNSRSRESGSLPPPVPPATGKRGATGGFSVLGPDVVIVGNIAATADLHIDGRVEGDVACGVLTQGTESAIHGSVTAESARLAGTVEGKVRVRQLVVERSALLTGDIEYEAIMIENGAQVDGALKRSSSLAAQPTPLLPRQTVKQEVVEQGQLTG